MSAPTSTAQPLPSKPLADPPTTALPPIPKKKLPRKSLPVSTTHISSNVATPSLPSRPSVLPSPQHVKSTPDIPTFRSGSSLGQARVTEKTVRKTISIGSFPQPPVFSRPDTAASMVSTNPAMKRTSDGSVNSVRPRTRRSPRVSTTSSNTSQLRSPQVPSLLNGSGAGKSIPIIPNRNSDGQSSGPSPTHSRSSSAAGSYSTSATTIDDGDDDRGRLRDEEKTTADTRRLSRGKDSKGNVVVSVRVRPDASDQDAPQSEGEWMVDGRRNLIAYKGKEGGDYYLDHVFGTHDNNAKVYDASAKRLVRRVMEGYHGTVFAYGMTGTGKTFSMQGTASNPGVIPLAITDIFSYIRETPHREFLLRVSYLEIYNEKIHDLLAAQSGVGLGLGMEKQEEIKIREDPKRGVYVTPLKEEIVQSPTQLLRVIARGDHARRTSSTQYNARSSRSHAVVQIVVESRERTPGSGTIQEGKRIAMLPSGVRVSTLSLIDLAGSERAAEDKERRTEGAHINKSLLTLGTVIAKLSADKEKGSNHLPYRDSNLTRLLQPALSGNSLVSILCTIQLGSLGSSAAGNTHIGETLNTLKFAARARNNIVSHAKKAVEEIGGGAAGLLEKYKLEIESLRAQLSGQQKVVVEKEEKVVEKETEQRHEEQMLEMQLARTALKERIEHLNRLILCSKSTGVNSGTVSALGMHGRLSGGGSTEFGLSRSVRSSASQSTLGVSGPPLVRHPSLGSIGPTQHPFRTIADEEDAGGEFADGMASLEAQNRALQADLQDKNRYITTLEKRLLQARRSSHSRVSMGFNKQAGGPEDYELQKKLEDRNATIADLRAKLDDKDKMVNALRSAAKKRELAQLAPETLTTEFKLRKHSGHQSNDSNSSSLTSQGTSVASPLSPVTPISPMALLSPQKTMKNGKRKSVDEMSRMLDEMIQDKVEQGHLVKSKSGSVRIAVPSRSTSRAGQVHSSRRPSDINTVPQMASLVATLREGDGVLVEEPTSVFGL